MTRVLIVDPDYESRETMAQFLHFSLAGGCDTEFALTADACLDRLMYGAPFDCIIVEDAFDPQNGAPVEGLDLLERIVAFDPFLAVILVTARGDETVAVKALQAGAQDYYVRRMLTPAGIERCVTNAIARAKMARRIDDQQHSLRTFAHVLVHDLRAPLRSVRGGVSMLMEDLPPEQARAHADVLGFIRHGADRMDQLIVALYDFVSIDSGEVLHRDIDLNSLVTSLERLLHADLAERGACLTKDPDLPEVQGDPAQILQLLQNLVSNGIKYNTSTPPKVHIWASSDADAVTLRVSDNGIGIEDAYLSDIFQPFRRLHRDEEYEGTGLGLATCVRIAHRHGGALRCRSVLGEGSEFILTLPRFSHAACAQETPPLAQALRR